jgi:hypothetical protein
MDKDNQGIAWERDPAKHRQIAKRLSPAFSMKSLKSKELSIHKYIDLFMQRMREVGNRDVAVDLKMVSLVFAINLHP